MSRKKKKRKQLRCVVCNNDVDKRDTVPVYNLPSARSSCKSCIPDFKEDKRYMWNKEKTQLVPGYTQSELLQIKRSTMTPEEVARDIRREKRKGHEALLALHSMSLYSNIPFFRHAGSFF